MESQVTLEGLKKIVDRADQELRLLNLLVKNPIWTGKEHIYVTPSYAEARGHSHKHFVICPENCCNFFPNRAKLYRNAVWCPYCKDYFPIVCIEDIPEDERPDVGVDTAADDAKPGGVLDKPTYWNH